MITAYLMLIYLMLISINIFLLLTISNIPVAILLILFFIMFIGLLIRHKANNENPIYFGIITLLYLIITILNLMPAY